MYFYSFISIALLYSDPGIKTFMSQVEYINHLDIYRHGDTWVEEKISLKSLSMSYVPRSRQTPHESLR